ncbi:hypothetical protein [Chitinimonas sp.]|uniref:hypothetical protein n=1 Tax=Chitinimonas sp. TaxID=1934313 RepID=UPI0035B48026
MKNILVVVLSFCALLALPQADETDGLPYKVDVWSSVLFDANGNSSDIDIAESANYPAAFLDNVRARLAKAHIQAPVVDGRPATFKTGVLTSFTITPSAKGGSAKLDSLSVLPLPIKTYMASFPDEVGKAGEWHGSLTVRCEVDVSGKCGRIDVEAPAGIPESVRRFAKVSLEGWLFQPQEVNGQAVPGEYRLGMNLGTRDDFPEDFRIPKFNRLMNGR